MIPKVEFKINPKEEAKKIPNIVNLVGYSMFSKEVFDKLKWKTKKQIYPVISKIHKKHKKKMVIKKNTAEKAWRKIEKQYFIEMEKIIGQKLVKKKNCYFTPAIKGGIADVIGKKDCFIEGDFPYYALNYIVMHEITHLYYSDALVQGNLMKQGMNSPLMEGVAHMILFKSPVNKLLKAKTKYEKLCFVVSNPKFIKELEKLWKQRKDFPNFVKKAYVLSKKFPNIRIC